MPTLPHQNATNGYSLRIGKHLPPEAANLAYVHTDTPAPEKNLLVLNSAEEIPENRERPSEILEGLYSERKNEGRTAAPVPAAYLAPLQATSEYQDLLCQNGSPYLAKEENLLLTNQYTVDVKEAPLFYICASEYPADLKNTMVRPYVDGRRGGAPVVYGSRDTASLFIYEGNRILFTHTDGENLTRDEHVKVLISPTKEKGIGQLYFLTSFSGSEKGGYQVTYPSVQNGKTQSKTETLNLRPLFLPDTGVDGRFELTGITKRYRLEPIEKGDGYHIWMESTRPAATASQEVNFQTRPPHTFSYQIVADVATRFSARNPITLSVGLLYVNDSVHSAIPLTSAMKKLVYQNPFLPDYLGFKNPHRESGENLPQSTNYWLASLQMPKEHYLDYDILILAGYGQKDLTPYAENIRSFLDAGGMLLVDNNGESSAVLDFRASGKQTFVADISFSSTQKETGRLVYGKADAFSERYYPKEDVSSVGVSRPVLQFLNQESRNDWESLLQHEAGGMALAKKKGLTGHLYLSTLGLLQDVVFGKEQTLRLLANLFLYAMENRSFRTPVFQEQVLHRDDLFEEDYTEANGKVRYLDDQSDQDQTRLVAKKQLAEHVSDVADRYLPYPYQHPIASRYQILLKNSGEIKLQNPGFEAGSETSRWVDTAPLAMPGFRYVVLSKGTVSEAGISALRKSGRQSAYLTFTNTRGFLEQLVPDLIAGDYEFRVAVRTESVTAGGISVYDKMGKVIAASEPTQGTRDWYTLRLAFSLEEAGDVYLRAGSSESLANGTFYFDDWELVSQGVVRMTPSGSGQQPLYAYALRSRGQNFLLTNQLEGEVAFLRSEKVLKPTVRIRSFVYEWNVEKAQFQKQYGREAAIKVSVSRKEEEKVLGRLLDMIPGKEAGYQWRQDQNVFYEIELDSLAEETPYINLSIYDPSTQTYFYSPNGEWVLNREDLWWDGAESTVQLRIRSVADALQVAGSKYTLSYPNNQRIALLPPATNDERDRWYVRIHKGGFTRKHVASKDVQEMTDTNRGDFYQEFLSGTHRYALPEYERQSFYPRAGERLIEDERAVYLNRNTIQVAHLPLLVSQRRVTASLFNLSGDKRTYRGFDSFWDKNEPVAVYQDNQQILEGYEIDFVTGVIQFSRDVSPSVLVSADYSQNNLRVSRRKLANARIRNERLIRVDDTTLQMSRNDIAVSPHPTFYREGSLIHPGEYWVDFDAGLLHFYEPNRKNIYADYSYYTKEELVHTDINRYTGEIRLKRPIHFRDEIIVDYLYEENALEYKGYRDPETSVFQHLDINPTAGHTYTKRLYQEDGTFLQFQEESSEHLLNKEIYFYLLPVYSRYISRSASEDEPMRHCFGETEWRKVKAAHPEALLLGRVQVRENTDIENAVVLDARRLGGGLKEHFTQTEIEKRAGFTSAFWDIGGFDGLAYYQNGVTVIRLPERILKANGGDFSEQDIRDILSKYLAFGIYPLIEYLPDKELLEEEVPDTPETLIEGNAILFSGTTTFTEEITI